MAKQKKRHSKRNGILILLLLVLFAVGVGGSRGSSQPEAQAPESSVFFDISSSAPAEEEKGAGASAAETPSSEEQQIASTDTALPDKAVRTLSVEDIPAYSGSAFVELNGNVPDFTDEEYGTEAFEEYSPLDELGRCGAAYACVGQEIMPTEERGAIGMVKPSGWHTVKYDFVDGRYLYNRCHLIAYQLSGENANTQNLITGTRYLNTEGMLPYENQVADYVHDTGNHVLYRVTPVFAGDNLLASGVEIEASSVEDKGKSLSFHVYCYNVQPGVTIDYATGDSAEDEAYSGQGETAEEAKENTAKSPAEPDNAAAAAAAAVADADRQESVVSEAKGDIAEEQAYVLNKNTKKFHYPWCSSADDIKQKNRKDFTGTREEVISQGYVPCKRCNP